MRVRRHFPPPGGPASNIDQSKSSSERTTDLRIITHNIRYSNTASPFPGELAWIPYRRTSLLRHLKYHSRHPGQSIICLQEVLRPQLLDVLAGLNGGCSGRRSGSRRGGEDLDRPGAAAGAGQDPGSVGEWDYYGLGRDDGISAGEHEPIFWRSGIWRRVYATTIWLCEDTPFVPGSRGWDAASVRVCGVVVLERREQQQQQRRQQQQQQQGEDEGVERLVPGTGPEAGGDRIMILNTHLDDQGRVSRIQGAKLILRFLRRWKVRFGVADDRVVVAGDLNSEVTSTSTTAGTAVDADASISTKGDRDLSLTEGGGTEEGTDAWAIFNAADSGLGDVRSMLVNRDRRTGNDRSAYAVYGDDMTFTGFNGHGDSDGRCRRIDFIFVGVGVGVGVDAGDGDGDGDDAAWPGLEGEGRGEGQVGGGGREGRALVRGYAVLPNRFDDGVYMSDHRAVVADLVV